MKVAKFGGSSLANAKSIKNCLDIVIKDGNYQVVVCSAPGKSSSEDIKMTDLLLQFCDNLDTETPHNDAVEKIIKRAKELITALNLNPSDPDFDFFFSELQNAQENFGENLKNQILPLGEQFSSHLFSKLLNMNGIRSLYLDAGEAGIRTSSSPSSQEIDLKSLQLLKKNLSPLLKDYQIIVIPGFYGWTKEGKQRILSRSGSDVSATWIASSLNADCDIWTDVNGVLEADPRKIAESGTIPYLSYREITAMANFGANVLHRAAIVPLVPSSLKCSIRNSFNPDHPGTVIWEYAEIKRDKAIAICEYNSANRTGLALIGEGLTAKHPFVNSCKEKLNRPGLKLRCTEAAHNLPAVLLTCDKNSSDDQYYELWKYIFKTET